MRQIFPGGMITQFGASRVYALPFGHLAGGSGNSASAGTPWAATGQLTNVRISLSQAITVQSTFTIHNLTQVTQLDVTVPVSTTDITSAGTLAVTAGDLVAIQLPASAVGTPYIKWSFEFIGTTANQAVLGGANYVSEGLDELENNKFLFLFPDNRSAATEASRRFYCPISGTLQSFYVKLSANSGSTGTRTLSIYKNGSILSATSLTFSSSDSAKNVTGLGISFVPGDYFTLHHGTTGDVSDVHAQWGMMYNPTVDGEFMLGGLLANPLSNTLGVKEYGWFAGAAGGDPYSFDAIANEPERQSVSGGVECLLRTFRVDLETAPGTLQTRRFRFWKNHANSTVKVDISGAETTKTDSSHPEVIADGAIVGISHEVMTGGVNNNATTRWSFGLYIDPAGSAVLGDDIVTDDPALPVNNSSIVTAVARVQQDMDFPQFVMGVASGPTGTAYGLYKKSTTYDFNLFRTPPIPVGKDFDVINIEFPVIPGITGNMEIIPVLYFDDATFVTVGTEINATNYENSEKLIRLNSKNFRNRVRGKRNFFLELQFTGTALAVVELPIRIEIDELDT